MKTVGIIVNPASGKDIRRVIARGMTVTNQEKINAVCRMVLAMDALGVERVEIMPESTGIVRRVRDLLGNDLNQLELVELEMPYIIGTQKDTIRAAKLMEEQDFGCVIVMGGDGTSRVTVKGSNNIPLLPVSTGTNNVFPQMVEGTLAGLAAAAIATNRVCVHEACQQSMRLELLNEASEIEDIALVDLVVVDEGDIGARAVWDESTVKELFLTHSRPSDIGLSAIGGCMHPLPKFGDKGLHIELGMSGQEVLAPVAPGMLKRVHVSDYQVIEAGRIIPLKSEYGVVALDGERELNLKEGEKYRVFFNQEGPQVIDVDRTLELLIASGAMSAIQENL